MIRLIQRRLIIPRGDTGTFTVPVLATKNTGDVAVFSIIDTMTDKKVFEKIVNVSGDTMTIEFSHYDTVNLPVGKYVWDIKFYQNPEFMDGVLVNGVEVDSYYAAFTMPICEIRQTGDNLLMADDAPGTELTPDQLDILNAAVNETNAAKSQANESAASANTAATTAADKADEATAKAEEATAKAEEATAALNELKEILPTLAEVATSGSYEDLEDKPFIPSRVSDLTDDSGHYTKPANGIPASDLEETYLTEHQDLSNYVQKTDYATTDNAGVIKYNIENGISVDANGTIKTVGANASLIKAGSNGYRPIIPAMQHNATFYGLAKAAGDTTQSQSNNAVGTYTDSAKIAIQQMLDVPSTAAIPTAVSQLINDSGYLTSFTETDPTVPAWAKQAEKPAYTAAEVGAPTVQEMNTAIGNAIGNINSFDMAVVQELPTQDISTHTIYLVPKTGETNDVYDEYVYINSAWEMVGNTQIDLSNYVQKTDYATAEEPGVIRIDTRYGISMSGAYITTNPATMNNIKTGTNTWKPITPENEHASAFYGLAKAAGDTTQSQSDNAVGTYTNEAKAAIQQMLDVPAKADIPDTSIYAEKTEVPVKNGGIAGGVKTKDFLDIDGTISHQISSNYGSFAEGRNTTASGQYSHAEGSTTVAQGYASHSEGHKTSSKGNYSHAEGRESYANSSNSHVEGRSTIADSSYQHVQGKYNVSDNQSIYADIVGNGTADNTRSNAYALTWTGNAHYAGDVYVHANADSTGGTKLATIEDIPNVPVQDVQVNGVSVLQDGVANVPTISDKVFGVAKLLPSGGQDAGIAVDSQGRINVQGPTANNIKRGEGKRPLSASNQHMSVFYGLAASAGDTTQSASDNAVGNYTDTAKEKIQSMLGITQMLAPVNPNMTAAQAYGVGEVFAANGKLYKATAAIAQDAAIIPETNCVETTIAEAGGRIKDVQLNGTSIVGSNGTVNIPIASTQIPGVVTINVAYSGLQIYNSNNGGTRLEVLYATSAQIKQGSNQEPYRRSIYPGNQHESVFYGLSKVAGVDLKNETVTLGEYPEASKTAIKQMLGVQDGLKVVRLI